jgi:hypothetical protein
VFEVQALEALLMGPILTVWSHYFPLRSSSGSQYEGQVDSNTIAYVFSNTALADTSVFVAK